jgi:hypothetical protein
LCGRSSFTYYFLDGDGSRLREGYSYQYLEVADARHRALLEALAVGWLCPAYLGVGQAGGEEEMELEATTGEGG